MRRTTLAALLAASTRVHGQTFTSDVTASQSLRAGTGASDGSSIELRLGGIFIATGGSNSSVPATTLLNTDGGTGVRVLWYPGKAAFRAGMAENDSWNDIKIGLFSSAFGQGTVASGEGSFAVGHSTMASGSSSFAGGAGTQATGVNSVTFGSGSLSDGFESSAFGRSTWALADYSIAAGLHTNAEAMGVLVIGQYNVGGGSSNTWVGSDPIFEIGNGSPAVIDPSTGTQISEETYSNAFTVHKNGDVSITGKVTMPRQGDILMGEFGN